MADQPARPMRICDVCGQVDDHPRHAVAFAPGDAPAPNEAHVAAVIGMEDLDDETKAAIVKDIYDTTLQLRHMDCCRSVGCPSGDCDRVPDLRGDELLAAIQDGE